MTESVTVHSQSTHVLATSPPHNPSDISLALETKSASSAATIFHQANLPLSPPTESSLTPSLSDLENSSEAIIEGAVAAVMGVVTEELEVVADIMEEESLVLQATMVEDIPSAPSAINAAPIPGAVPPKLTPGEIKSCKSVLSSLQRHNAAWPFKVPVDPVVAGAPDYFNIVRHPMDLQTVGQKLTEGSYTVLTAFVDDVKLIFDNCFLYNPPTHFVHQQGRQLEKYFSNLLNRTFPLLPIYNRPQMDAMANPAVVKKPPAVKVPSAAALKRKRNSVILDADIVVSPSSTTAGALIDITGDGPDPAPVIPTGPEVHRSTRERKPKKIYEPEDLRRPSDDLDANGLKRRRSSVGKGSKKKKSEEVGAFGAASSLAASIFALQQQLETLKRNGKKKKVKQTEALLASALTAVAFSGLVGANNSDSDSSSDEETAKKAVKKSSSASASSARRKSKSSSKVDVPRVGGSASSGGPIVEDLDGGAVTNDVAGAKRCEHCGTVSTSQWRRGPSGSQTLCNKCGIKWKESGCEKSSKKRRPSSSPSPPATTPAASVRVVTYDEKRQLSDMIGSLTNKHQMGVIDIIRSGMPQLSGEGEIELDIDALDRVTLVKLFDFVKGCAEEDRRNSEKAKEAARKAASAMRREREGLDSSDSSGSDDSGSDSD
ncbi:hypothetical protein HDU67_003575 [Dinochytrium kinnereticum]|nr:hypothetical protein HDU67_003575 [Dinochytrium kinnereticum]